MLWIVLLSLVTVSVADHRYAFSCPPRLFLDYPEDTACRLTLSCGNSTASVQISTADGTDSITLQPGEPHIQVMDQKFQTDNGIQNKGVMVASDQELHCVLDQMDEYSTTTRFTDSTQIHPIFDDSDHHPYYLASYKGPFNCASTVHTQFYTVAATCNNTQLEIYDRDELQESVSLDQYQTYTYVTTDIASPIFDPTGLKVQSNKPVSVISGALCEIIDAGSTFITSIQPRSYTQFVAPHLGNSQNTGYTLKLIGHEDSTRITVNGEDSIVNEGEFIRVHLPGRTMTSAISCNQPCSAYIVSIGYDAEPPSGKQESLLSIIPTAAMYTAVHFTTLDYEYTHFVSITAEGEGPYDDILLDGATLAGQTWAVLEGFSSTWFEISKGPHWLTTTGRRLAAYIYGHSGFYGGGYGHSVWSVEEGMDTTTYVPETTPALPARPLPTYRIHTNGSAQTPDGSQISPLCAAGYVGTMSENNDKMAAQVEGMIGATLCSQSPDMQITAAFVNLLFDLDKASVSLEYHLTVAQQHQHEDIDRCASEVALYVTDHANWQLPILHGKDGCLDLVFASEEFHHHGNFWECPDQEEDPAKFAENTLLYSHKVYDVLDTVDGSSLSQACVDKYAEVWTRKVSSMASAINQAVEQGLCEEPATSVTSYAGYLSSLGTQAMLLAEFFHTPSYVMTFAEFLGCSDVALTFSLSRASWGQPFLPTPSGCPELVADLADPRPGKVAVCVMDSNKQH